MKSKLKTVSFGIPAFNEEANIKKLIKDILNQKQTNFTIDRIIVVSDGSTDKTIEEVQSIKNKRITLINHTDRTGKTVRQNEILKLSDADYLIFCDADITFSEENFIDSIIGTLLKKKSFGVAGMNTTPLPAENFLKIA